ncbi:hypothetical protein GCM10020331_064920 [Ectobacillus funiculus]
MAVKKKTVKSRDTEKNIDMILVLTDFVNHNLSTVIKQKKQKKSIYSYFLCKEIVAFNLSGLN